jgi:hypothetical protein
MGDAGKVLSLERRECGDDVDAKPIGQRGELPDVGASDRLFAEKPDLHGSKPHRRRPLDAGPRIRAIQRPSTDTDLLAFHDSNVFLESTEVRFFDLKQAY